ncbi:MAG: hypothetical protein IT368_02695 [Candidatus Hydrogenedentes bacterium]|nr:hypothetical protein [Candidatus Hydrogenedentota bacterium]
MLRSSTIVTIVSALAFASMPGCDSGTPVIHSELPPAGSLEVISVTPLEGEQRQNLLQNGSFDEWYAGAPGPTGFTTPKPGLSTLRRDAEIEAMAPLGFRAIQRWKKSDSETLGFGRFGTYVDVIPGADYELHVIATSWSGGTAIIDVFQEKENGGLELLQGNVITVEPDVTVKEYTATFNSGEATRIFIASGSPPGVEPAGSVVWHDWFLY